MTDIKLTWDNDNGVADMSITDSDFTKEAGLETAVLISLFTDRRADVDDARCHLNAPAG